MGGQGGDGGGRVGGGFVVDLDDDEGAAGVFGEGVQGLGGVVRGVAHGGDDGGRGAGEVGFDEAEADAWVGLVGLVVGVEGGLEGFTSVGTGDEDVGV